MIAQYIDFLSVCFKSVQSCALSMYMDRLTKTSFKRQSGSHGLLSDCCRRRPRFLKHVKAPKVDSIDLVLGIVTHSG